MKKQRSLISKTENNEVSHITVIFFKLDFEVLSKMLRNQIKIKFFIMLAELCQSVQQVCGAHFHVIVPARSIAHFQKISQRWRAVGNTVSNLTGRIFKPQTCR